MSFRNIFTILFKDLIDVIQSKAVWVSLASPIILSLFFSMAYSSPRTLPDMIIYDPGNSGFEDFLKESEAFTIKRASSRDDGLALLNKGKSAALLILPENFDEQIFMNSCPSVNMVVSDSVNSQSQMVLAGLLEVFRAYANQPFPVSLEVEELDENRLEPRQEMLPVWILLTIMGSLVVTTSSLMEEKEKKTLNALLVSPASIYDVIIGKCLLGIILTVTSSFLLLLLNGGLIGNLSFLFSVLFLGGICFSIWGILVALIAQGQTAANSINSLLFIFLMIPVVLSDNSRILRILSRGLPSYYLVDGLRKSMEGAISFSDLYIHYILLGGFSVVLFGICLRIISRQES